MGVKYNSLVKHCSDMITVMAMTMFDTGVSQPALKFTAVRENEPVHVHDKEFNYPMYDSW